MDQVGETKLKPLFEGALDGELKVTWKALKGRCITVQKFLDEGTCPSKRPLSASPIEMAEGGRDNGPKKNRDSCAGCLRLMQKLLSCRAWKDVNDILEGNDVLEGIWAEQDSERQGSAEPVASGGHDARGDDVAERERGLRESLRRLCSARVFCGRSGCIYL